MGVACDSCGVCPIVGQRFNSQVVMNNDLCVRCHALPAADSMAPFRLVENQFRYVITFPGIATP